METLWRRIQRYVVQGKETPKVDLKRELTLDNKKHRAEFAKDVMAIANTRGGDGFLILGVNDKKHSAEDVIVGFTAVEGADAFYMKMLDAIHDYANPGPVIEYEEINVPGTVKQLGIVTVQRSIVRPHSFRRDCEAGQQNAIPIRRGTKTFYGPTRDELQEMMTNQSPLPSVILISLSGRPLSPEQLEQINQRVYIEELIELTVNFHDMQPMQTQIEEIVEQIGLTDAEWNDCSIVINPPGIAAPTTAFMAYIHGLRGSFPDVVYIARGDDGFVVKQQIPLQEIRDYARNSRLKS